MQELLILPETAKLAKEKGFDWIDKDKPYYSSDHNIWGAIQKVGIRLLTSWIDSYKSNKEDIRYNYISLRPTQAMLQKWLRDVHLIDVIVSREGTIATLREGFSVMIYSAETTIFPWELGRVHKIYEEALETGLLEALKLIK